MVDSFPILASYLPVTLFITLVSGVLGIFLGMGLAVIRVKEIPGLNLLTGCSSPSSAAPRSWSSFLWCISGSRELAAENGAGM